MARGLATLGLRCLVQGPPELPLLRQVGQAATELYLLAWFPWPRWGACPGYQSRLLCHFTPHLSRSSQSSQLPVEPAGISFTGLCLVLYSVCAVWSCGIEADVWAWSPACSVAGDLGHPYPGHQLLGSWKPRDSGSIGMAPVSPFWGLRTDTEPLPIIVMSSPIL